MSLVSVASELICDVVKYIFPSGNSKDEASEYESLIVNFPVISFLLAEVVAVVVAVNIIADFQVDYITSCVCHIHPDKTVA